MTRDEATGKLYRQLLYMRPGTQVNSFDWCGGIVDALIDLNLLKVDADADPLNPLQVLARSLNLATQSLGPLTAAKVNGHLEDLGFKVVKK